MPVQLTDHFSLEELSHSDVAIRRGLDNVPNAGEVANLMRLAETLLEPVRELLGVGLTVNSGFRCPGLNQAVGGAIGSAHMDGRAADVVPVGMTVADAFYRIKRSGLPYDQLIFECGSWLHLAVAKVGADPRQQVLAATGGPGAWKYAQVIG